MREIGVGSGHISGMSDPRGGSDSDRDSLTGWTLVDREGTPEPHDPQQDEEATGIAGAGAVEDLEEEEDEGEEEEDESGCGMEEDEGEEDLPEDLLHMGQHVQEVKEKHANGSSEKPLNQNDSPAKAGKETDNISELVEDKESQHEETPLKIEKLTQKLGDLTITEELASAEISEKSLNDNKTVIENVVIKQSPSFEIPKAIEANILNLGAKPKTNNSKDSLKTKNNQKLVDVSKEEESKMCPLKSDADKPRKIDIKMKQSMIDETLKEKIESIVDDSHFKSTNDSSENVNVNILLKDEAVAPEGEKKDSKEISETLKKIDNDNPIHEVKASPSEIPINELVEAMREEVPLEEPLIEDILNVETQPEDAIPVDQSKEASKILPENGDLLEITSTVSPTLLEAKPALESELPSDMTSTKNPIQQTQMEVETSSDTKEIPLVEEMREKVPLEEPLIEDILNVETHPEDAIPVDQSAEASKILPETGDILEITSAVSPTLLEAKPALESKLTSDMTSTNPSTQQTQMDLETSSDTQEIPLGIGAPSDTSKENDLQVLSLDTIIQPEVFTKEVDTSVNPIDVRGPSNVSLIESSTQESPLEVKEVLDAPPIESVIPKSDYDISVETMKKNEISESNEKELTIQDENDKSNKSEIEVDYQDVDKIPSDSPTLTDAPGSLVEPAGDADVESLASTTDISVLDDDKDIKESAAMVGLKDDETDLSLASSPSLPEDLPAIKKISRKERKLELARGETEPSSPSVVARLMDPFLPSLYSRSQVLNVWPLSLLRQKEGEEGEDEGEKVEEEAISNETASFSGAWLYDRALQTCSTLEQSYSVVEDKFNALNPWGPDKQYQHTPSSKFNGRLNTIVMLTIATVCGLAIGHFLGFIFSMSGAGSTGWSSRSLWQDSLNSAQIIDTLAEENQALSAEMTRLQQLNLEPIKIQGKSAKESRTLRERISGLINENEELRVAVSKMQFNKDTTGDKAAFATLSKENQQKRVAVSKLTHLVPDLKSLKESANILQVENQELRLNVGKLRYEQPMPRELNALTRELDSLKQTVKEAEASKKTPENLAQAKTYVSYMTEVMAALNVLSDFGEGSIVEKMDVAADFFEELVPVGTKIAPAVKRKIEQARAKFGQLRTRLGNKWEQIKTLSKPDNIKSVGTDTLGKMNRVVVNVVNKMKEIGHTTLMKKGKAASEKTAAAMVDGFTALDQQFDKTWKMLQAEIKEPVHFKEEMKEVPIKAVEIEEEEEEAVTAEIIEEEEEVEVVATGDLIRDEPIDTPAPSVTLERDEQEKEVLATKIKKSKETKDQKRKEKEEKKLEKEKKKKEREADKQKKKEEKRETKERKGQEKKGKKSKKDEEKQKKKEKEEKNRKIKDSEKEKKKIEINNEDDKPYYKGQYNKNEKHKNVKDDDDDDDDDDDEDDDNKKRQKLDDSKPRRKMDEDDDRKHAESKMKQRWSKPGRYNMRQENVASNSKFIRRKGKNSTHDSQNRKGKGYWDSKRGKGREDSRKQEKRSEWQFDRARDRRDQREQDKKAEWYFDRAQGRKEFKYNKGGNVDGYGHNKYENRGTRRRYVRFSDDDNDSDDERNSKHFGGRHKKKGRREWVMPNFEYTGKAYYR